MTRRVVSAVGERGHGSDLAEDIRNDGTEAEPGLGPTSFKGENLGQVFSDNIVADNTGTGWYADIGAKGCRIIGNAFWNNTGGSIYNEAAVDDSLIIGNYFHKNGMSSSCCVRMSVVDNFFDECGVVWHNRDWIGLRSSYMVLRGNAFFKPSGGYLADFGIGYGKAP
jgi:hypothetical protein